MRVCRSHNLGSWDSRWRSLEVSPKFKSRWAAYGRFYHLFWKMGKESAGRGHGGAWGTCIRGSPGRQREGLFKGSKTSLI